MWGEWNGVSLAGKKVSFDKKDWKTVLMELL